MRQPSIAIKYHCYVLAAIILLTILAFFPTFGNDFQMKWDDQWMVYNSLTESHIDIYLLKCIFTVPFSGQWGPLNQLMYTLLCNTFGYSPMAFHTASLIMHLFNVGLVYIMLHILLRDCTSLSTRRTRFIVLVSTLLFAIHPLQVETVAWISASKILMSTFFLSTGIHNVPALCTEWRLHILFSRYILFYLFLFFQRKRDDLSFVGHHDLSIL